MLIISIEGFPGGSDGKESACNVGDMGLISGLERSPRGGNGNPLQYSCLENPHEPRILVAQMVKNLLAIQETWVQSLGWEDLLEEGMVIHFSILAWRIPVDRGA